MNRGYNDYARHDANKGLDKIGYLWLKFFVAFGKDERCSLDDVKVTPIICE
jgi:hypothetical protein